jgi:CRP-like cAMP-binding protein
MSTGAAEDFAVFAEGGLTAVEKVLALQRVPLFARVEAPDMLALANVARTVPIAAGARLFDASAPPALWIILSGAVTVGAEGSAVSAGPGSAIGIEALLRGNTLGVPADGTRPGLALRVDREDLFDLIEQRPGLLQQVFVALFKSLEAERVSA